ncbi:MAG TPA: DUF4224 domain-containing protein [Gammaproteobacteria bacterium]
MPNDLTLSDDELVELTGKKRPSAQARALRIMGIDHRIRPDGKVVVLRAQLEQAFGVKRRPEEQVVEAEINWD